MKITELAIKYNRVTFLALLIILFGGISSYLNLSRAEDPGFVVRTATVITYFDGASPKRVEELVTDKLEESIKEMPEIDFITSQSKNGVSIVFVNILESYKNMQPIWDKLRRKVDKTRLPLGTSRPIVNDEFGDIFGTIVTLRGEGFSYRELKDIADDVKDELLRISLVSKVEIEGAREERIFIEYRDSELSKLGVSVSQLQSILQNQNIISSGGDILVGKERINIEPSGNFESIEEIKNTIINIDGKLIELRDIATIKRDYQEPVNKIIRFNGENSLVLAISLREGGNIIELGELVKEKINYFQNSYPIGIEFDYMNFQPKIVEDKVGDFINNLLQSMAIILVVMLIFLGFRTGLLVATLVPMAILMSLLIMKLSNIGLDQMSIASLIIALGLLVDNAIVISESIMVSMKEGLKPLEAIKSSSKELSSALLISSLTTAFAFLPIVLAESATGEYTQPLFSVVTITLLSSWLLALTMIPLFCFYFLKVEPSEVNFKSLFYRIYRATIVSALKVKYLSIILIIGLFFIAIKGLDFVPKIFFPESDKKSVVFELTLPATSDIETTLSAIEELESYIDKNLQEKIVNYTTFIGSGAPRFQLSYSPEMESRNYAYTILNTKDLSLNKPIIEELYNFGFNRFLDAEISVKLLDLGSPLKHQIEIRISGKEKDIIFEKAKEVKALLEKESGVRNIGDNWGFSGKKIAVNIDESRAKLLGLTSYDIALSLKSLSGFEISQYRESDKIIPIVMRVDSKDDLEKFQNMNVYSQNTGQSVPLLSVASLEFVFEPSKILRRDGLKTVTVFADITGERTAIDIVNSIKPNLESMRFDLGYFYELGGAYESSTKSNGAIGAKLPIAVILIVALLILQFNSFRKSFIILFTIPLGMIGVTTGLIVANSYMGFMTFLGIISLSGMVINNAVVLLERIKLENEENGLSMQDAIVTALLRRFRPIMLTTITTVGGLMPLWISGGPLWEPMAIALIFGLMFATILTLIVVPVLYSILFRVTFKGYKLS